MSDTINCPTASAYGLGALTPAAMAPSEEAKIQAEILAHQTAEMRRHVRTQALEAALRYAALVRPCGPDDVTAAAKVFGDFLTG